MKLFDECIVGFLKDKTRLLVTNQLQCLPKCDTVIALGKGGRVVEQGSYTDLMNVESGEVYRLLKDLEEAAKKQAEDSALREQQKQTMSDNASPNQQVMVMPSNVEAKEKDGKPVSLVTQEEREVGAVKMDVYVKYIRAAGGFLRLAFVILFFILSSGMNLATGVWISLWTSDTSYERNGEGFYIGGYALFAVLVGVFTFCRSYLLATFGVEASRAMHIGLLKSILRAPMSFFDTTPTGRILSRFSKDMHTIDQELADYLDFVIFMFLSLLVTISTIVFATPWFGIALIPLGYLYIRILNYFRDVSRETKRLESLSRSPVYAHFSETLGGLSTIRAYGESVSFVTDFENKLDGSTKAIYSNKSADRWLSSRLELIGACIAGLAAVFATQVVVSNGTSGIGETDSFSSLAGLSLTYAIQVTGMLQWVVRSFAQVEAAMNSAERVFYYSESIPKEAAMDSDDLETDASSEPSMNSATKAVVATGGKAVHPPKEWPECGAITMKNLQMRYRTETPLVLKGLNVTIAGGERVGVVGRTGSGKSSLLLCLMRIVEPELADKVDDKNYEAPLVIDGVDVLRVGLADLRTKLGIIPQDPVLFSGSIRSNMDPFNEYSDDEIWDALGKCGMRTAVLQMPNELLGSVAEYGENLSQGQRQLLCLGRALLKKCRILLLDEATSSVDYETDQEIQRTIREAFVGSTVLTIAHRVNTIMDSDKILVMKDGVAAEFAPPKELLNDETSLFSEIVHHSQAENEQ
jgi:ATP-binding cassette subfamily C (CFTR/MRP) protein 1